MKITYEFDPYEDKDDLRIFQKADKYHSVIWDITQLIRDFHKYPSEKTEYDRLKDLLETIENELDGLGIWEDC